MSDSSNTVRDYREFIRRKSQIGENSGFDPVWLPDFLFDFQRSLCEWAIQKGRGAILADCGLGKTPMQLVWAENAVRQTNKPVMIATPIAVGQQTLQEAEKFGITAKRTRDGVMTDEACVWVTNYEQLHKYDPSKFAGFVGDESSAIKDFKTERKASVVEFTRTLPYRLLCTATAAPNDFWELGTSSEALGYLGYRDMITTFFKQVESGGARWSGIHGMKYRFRGHAEQPFWSWVCSWARSLRKPSDLGFDDSRFSLPQLIETDHVVSAEKPQLGQLFAMPARDMREERAERRHTIKERCDRAAELAMSTDEPSVLWVELNDEGNELESLLSDCVQVTGSMKDEAKEEALVAFGRGQIKRLIIKPKIGAWGLNWQHCRNVIVFPSHSFESYYQLVRRCYRFGQTKDVTVHRILSEGEQHILANLKRKQAQAEKMFADIVAHMKDSLHLVSKDFFPETERIPSWLSSTKC